MRQKTVGTAFRILMLSLSVLLLSITPGSLWAQQDTSASISGNVVDLNGAVVPNAAILLRNQSTGTVTKSTADAAGHFAITGIATGRYALTIDADGFAETTKTDVAASPQAPDISIVLAVQPVIETVEVQAIAGDSIAGQNALSQGSLDTEAPKSEISSEYIRQFTPPQADYTEIIKVAPGTFSYSTDGIGQGQGVVYFRGFIDGDYDITWDGIPFDDTNTPTHHSWSFFPGVWVGGVDFDRSPGTASTIGPSTFGGSINLLSRDVPTEQNILGGVSYGSFNTTLIDGQYSTGFFGPGKKFGLMADVHRMSSDGFQTLNDQHRDAGDIKMIYKLSDRTSITGFSGAINLRANTPNNTPLRAQIANYGWNYELQNADPTSAFYQKYNYYTSAHK